MSQSPHSELIELLNEFYTLLEQLGAIGNDVVRRPDPTTGRHPPNAINGDAARAAGYSEDALNLMYQLPYLEAAGNEFEINVLYDSSPVNYLAADDEGYFKGFLETYEEDGTGMLPGSAVRLTHTFMYGTNLVYDVDSRLMAPFGPFSDTEDKYDPSFGKPVLEVLGPVIDKWRSLYYLAWPGHDVDWDPDYWTRLRGQPPDGPGWDERFKSEWRARYAVWIAVDKVRDIYLEYGWDKNSKTQDSFRRDEFLGRRTTYLQEVVGPLEDHHIAVARAIHSVE